MNDALLSQDKLHRCTVKERNELKVKLEKVLKDLEAVRVPIVSEETERDSCGLHMMSLATL